MEKNSLSIPRQNRAISTGSLAINSPGLNRKNPSDGIVEDEPARSGFFGRKSEPKPSSSPDGQLSILASSPGKVIKTRFIK